MNKGDQNSAVKARTKLSELFMQIGEEVTGTAMVGGVYLRNSADKGSSYMDLDLIDATGKFRGKIWSKSPFDKSFVAGLSGNVIEFTGMVGFYDGQVRVTINDGSWRMLSEMEYPMEEFAWGISDEAVEKATALISETIDLVEEPVLKLALQKCYCNRKVIEKLRSHPCGEWHHHFNGGLLLHIAENASIVRHVLSFMEEYETLFPYRRWLDRDIILSAALFCDLGKLDEYKPFPNFERRKAALLEGGSELSWDKTSQILGRVLKANRNNAEVRPLSEERLKNLKHCIKSATIFAEGSVQAHTAEAIVLHQCDTLSATMDGFFCAFHVADGIGADSEGGLYSKFFKRKIFERSDTSE